MKTLLASSLLFSTLVASQAFAGQTVLECESYGARAVVQKVSTSGIGGSRDQYKLILSGTVADFLKGEVGQAADGQVTGYGEGPFNGPKEWPQSLKAIADGSIEINGLYLRDADFLSYQYQPSFEEEFGGYKLFVPSYNMTSSHTAVYYEFGSWFFESCN